VDGIIEGGMMEKLLPFDAKNVVKVRFVDVNNSESVAFVIAWLFLYHYVNNGLPTIKRIVVTDCIVMSWTWVWQGNLQSWLSKLLANPPALCVTESEWKLLKTLPINPQ
jgi:hypothetical protein